MKKARNKLSLKLYSKLVIAISLYSLLHTPIYGQVPWTCATENAAWSKREGHASVIFDNKMWVIKGTAGSQGTYHDIWSSSDGIAWTCAHDALPWPTATGFPCVNYNKSMWVICGTKDC